MNAVCFLTLPLEDAVYVYRWAHFQSAEFDVKQVDFSDLLVEALQESAATYDEYHSPKNRQKRVQAWQEWGQILDLSDSACREIAAAVKSGGTERTTEIEERVMRALLHERLPSEPKVQARLKRALGEIRIVQGRTASAIQNFREALALDTKVGCVALLRRLEKQ